ncbi:unnamed protein product [Paramecium pentaurelia]|uniref:Transmembrane protein n=1 Tax=Paramecium pentaurelia TaxID=43138 RepID=A0A8S1XB14_9CILI|nr:unnamed protein product [Paramecium pentaurelia]
MIYILLTSILQIQAKSCTSTPITCESIVDIDLCQTIKDYNYNSICEWDDYNYKCSKVSLAKLSCNQFFNEYTCKKKSYKCFWEGQQTSIFSESSQQENTEGNCVDLTCQSFNNRFSCRSFADISCDWQNDNCIQVTKCEDFKTIKGCINSRFKQKCAAIVDGKVVEQQKRLAPDDLNLQCLIEDCKHRIKMADCNFVNGVQCFWRNNKCSKCSDYNTYDSCIKNQGQCFWNMNQCQNIECQQLSNPIMCYLKKGQCVWNQLKYKCELNSEELNEHCYQEYLSTQNKALQIDIMLLIFVIMIY